MLVVVQARTASTRLPGKVLLPLAGKPLLVRMIERLRAARHAFELVVATTTAPCDDVIVNLCARAGIPSFRGHPTDLLDRHFAAARLFQADVVVKIPSDCPLISPEVVDRVLEAWASSAASLDYLSNLHPPSYPDGNDVEVMSFRALATAWREAVKAHEREHTTPFLWDRPERFRLGNVSSESGQDLSFSHRFTIDYSEDYDLISALYDELYVPGAPVFSLADILELLDRRPDLRRINAQHHGTNWYRDHWPDLRTKTRPGGTREVEPASMSARRIVIDGYASVGRNGART